MVAVVILLVLLISFTEAFNPSRRIVPENFVGRLQLDMKKGRAGKVPIDQRGEFMKRQKMLETNAQIEANKPEGVPIFKVFVRPKAGGVWIPCGDLAGDQRATSLVNAWMSGFMSDMYKKSLDEGIARSIFNQEDAFVKSLIENYKPFRKFGKDDLVFGYKIDFPGLEEKLGPQKTTEIVRGMEKGWFDNIKDGFSNIFGNK